MGHRDDAQAAHLAQSRHGLHHERSVGRIERGRRFVQQENARVTEQGARDGHPLLLAAGESCCLASEQLLVESHLAQRAREARFGEVTTGARGTQQQVVTYRPLEKDRTLHHQGSTAPEPPGIERLNVAPLEANTPSGRLLEPIQTPQQARLPRA
jgi:hypothetical protein